MKLLLENWRQYLGDEEEISYIMSDDGITVIKMDETVGEMLVMKLDLKNPYLRSELASMTNKKHIYIVNDVWLNEQLQGKGIGKEMYKRASARWSPLVSQSAFGDEVSEQARRVWISLGAKSSEPFLNKEGNITQIWMLDGEESEILVGNPISIEGEQP